MTLWKQTSVEVIELSGTLDRNTIPELWQQAKAWPWDTSTLNLDFSRVESSDSAAMALILHIIQHAKKYHCHIMLRSVPDKLLTLFEVSNALPLIAEHLEVKIEG